MHHHVAEHCHGSCGWGNGGAIPVRTGELPFAPTTRGSLHGSAST